MPGGKEPSLPYARFLERLLIVRLGNWMFPGKFKYLFHKRSGVYGFGNVPAGTGWFQFIYLIVGCRGGDKYAGYSPSFVIMLQILKGLKAADSW